MVSHSIQMWVNGLHCAAFINMSQTVLVYFIGGQSAFPVHLNITDQFYENC